MQVLILLLIHQFVQIINLGVGIGHAVRENTAF